MKAHELVTILKTPLKLMDEKNIRPSSVGYLDMFHEYKALEEEGVKKAYIIAALCRKYRVGRTKLLELISVFESEV